MESDATNHTNPSASAGDLRNDSEAFRTVPKASASFGNVPHPSEAFRSVPEGAERKESHTLTVRDAARLFEAAGVARTERSIVNWCQLNGQGVARLDAYFDPNERKYFITPQSVEVAIAEERAKAVKANTRSEPVGSVRNDSAVFGEAIGNQSPSSNQRVEELQKEVVDLKITNRAKDYFIAQLKEERQNFVKELVNANRRVGELESRLLQLTERTMDNARRLEVRGD